MPADDGNGGDTADWIDAARGAQVVGMDAAEKNVAAAWAHKIG
jgi:2-polyprenyl-3-methyl-5-hydroxy-6-metoxy-1,4-benzoquinol methylase